MTFTGSICIHEIIRFYTPELNKGISSGDTFDTVTPSSSFSIDERHSFRSFGDFSSYFFICLLKVFPIVSPGPATEMTYSTLAP